MEHETPQQLFRDAADLIDRAKTLLDLRKYPPREGEQTGQFINFAHAKAHGRVHAMPDRLRRQAEFLDKKDEYIRADDRRRREGETNDETRRTEDLREADDRGETPVPRDGRTGDR